MADSNSNPPIPDNSPAPSAPPAELDMARIIGPIQCLSLFVLAFVVYLPALHGEFIWDDFLVVQQNPLVTGQLNLRSVWLHTDFPLSNVVLWLEWLLWRNDTTGYHVVNLLLHALNSVLVWRVLARLKIPGAWLAGALFTVHPVCVASVAWITELKNTLSLPFFLGSLWCYLRFDEASTSNKTFRTRCWYWLALALFLLALLAKTSTVMLPVVLLACAWWRRGTLARAECLRIVPFFVLSLAFGCMSIWFQQHQAFTTGPVQMENFFGRLAGAGAALCFYLGKALLPLDLSPIYPRWEIDPASPTAWLPLLCWSLLLFACWWTRRGWGRPALFAFGCFTVTLFPVLGFFDMYYLAISRVSDHFNYLPLICVVAGVGALLKVLLPRKVLGWAASLLLVALSVLTLQHARVFTTEERLWQDTLAKNPGSSSAHNNLGSIRAEQNRLEEALLHFEAAVRLDPQNAAAQLNLGRALARHGRFEEACLHFEASLKIKPNDPDTHYYYGQALAGLGRKGEAIAQFKKALRLQPHAETRKALDQLEGGQ